MGCPRCGVLASVPDRRGGRVSQSSRSDADDPRCISIESLTRQAPLPPPPVSSAQLISKRASGKTLAVTADWVTALSRVDKRRGRQAENGMKMTKTDREGRVRSRGVGESTHSASLPLSYYCLFALVTLGMNHGVTHFNRRCCLSGCLFFLLPNGSEWPIGPT